LKGKKNKGGGIPRKRFRTLPLKKKKKRKRRQRRIGPLSALGKTPHANNASLGNINKNIKILKRGHQRRVHPVKVSLRRKGKEKNPCWLGSLRKGNEQVYEELDNPLYLCPGWRKGRRRPGHSSI